MIALLSLSSVFQLHFLLRFRLKIQVTMCPGHLCSDPVLESKYIFKLSPEEKGTSLRFSVSYGRAHILKSVMVVLPTLPG